MKKTLLLVLILLSIETYSQISGKVKDENNQPMPFVNILLLAANDSSMTQGTISETNGQYSFESIVDGQYIIQANLIGYEDWYSKPLSYSGSSIKLDDFTIKESSVMLDGVEIKAERMVIEQSMEGTTVNVQNSIMSKGSTALQIIERSPGVVLDQRNNSLSLNGQSGTLVMINGRPVRMSPAEVINLLKGMSADNLEKVELLTNPSAKYDADGTAGIINLVIKKSEDQGTNGSFSLSGGYGYGSKEAASFNINHRNARSNYYGSYSFNHDNSFFDWRGVGGSDVPALGGESRFDFTNNTEMSNLSHNSMLGMETEFESMTVGTSLMFNRNDFSNNIFNLGKYNYADGSFLQADINVIGDGNTDNLNATAFIDKSFNNGSGLNLDVDYINYRNESPTEVESIYSDDIGNETQPDNELYANGNRGLSNTTIHIGVAKLDYNTSISNNVKLEAGIKGSVSESNNNAKIERLTEGEWVTDSRNVTRLEIKENIAAAYATININFDSLTSLSVGSRYEYWDRNFSDNTPDRSFGKFFPSAFLTRKLANYNSIQFVYNRRITRPDYNDLASFLVYNDPLSVFTGNPLLRPAISDNFKVSFQNQARNFSLVFTNENNPIARYQITENDESDLVLIAPQNVDYIRSLGFQTFLPIQVTKWWNINTGGTFSLRDFRVTHTLHPANETYFAYNVYANQNFSLPKNFSVELSGWYNSSHYNGSVRLEGFGMLNLGIKKELKNNQGTIQLAITDLFKSMTIKSKIGALTEEAWQSSARVAFQPESTNNRIFRLTYSRTFGGNKVKGRKQRQGGSDEEKSRVRN
ncbi:MAG: TonB-dependent receptor family protein [bacterium]|nr:TonB-dependent receptor family protein [bacterium]